MGDLSKSPEQARNYFIEAGFLENGKFTPAGLEAMAHLLDYVPTVQRGRWGPMFIPLMSRVVPAAIELVIVKDGKVLLTHREDAFFKGWHTPGSYIDPSENWQPAATRTAMDELGCDVSVERYLTSFLNTDNPRFPEVGNLILCRPIGNPQGTWFREKPNDLIPIHEKYWPVIEQALV